MLFSEMAKAALVDPMFNRFERAAWMFQPTVALSIETSSI